MTDTTTTPLRIVALAGSLRRGSWNRRLLEAARELAPAGLRTTSSTSPTSHSTTATATPTRRAPPPCGA